MKYYWTRLLQPFVSQVPTHDSSRPSSHSLDTLQTMSFVTVAAATLPSIPLDFKGNRDRILESIKVAKQKGATIRTGPEVRVWRGFPYHGANSPGWVTFLSRFSYYGSMADFLLPNA